MYGVPMKPAHAQWRVVGLAVFMALVAVGSADGQTLKSGIWTGTIEPPDGEYLDIKYNVRVESDTLKIRIITPEFGEFETTDVRIVDGVLLFGFSPGQPLSCELKPRDGGRFRGACVDSDGDPGYLTMIPPGSEKKDDGR